MFKLCVLTRWDFNFYVRGSPLPSSFGAWWGRCSYSPPLAKRRRQMSSQERVRELPTTLRMTTREHGGEILLLTPVWTLSSSYGAWWGDSLTTKDVQPGASRDSPHRAPNDDVRAWWGDSLTRPRLHISCRSAHGGQMPQCASNGNARCPAWGE